MFARLSDVPLKPGKKQQWVTVLTNEYQPLVRKQPGFVEFLGISGDTNPSEAMTLTLWATKEQADTFYDSHEFKKIMKDRINPLLRHLTVRTFNVETSTLHKVATAA